MMEYESKQILIRHSRRNSGVAINKTRRHIELALIELEYLAADTLSGVEGRSPDENSRIVASYYQSACKALTLGLAVIDQVETHGSEAAATRGEKVFAA